MSPLDALLAWPSAAGIAAVMMVAALAHGVIGFGFPVLSTPVVALFTDVQTAVIATLLPNLAVNLASMVKGGRWRESIARHWPVAVYVLVGTIVGTRALLVSNPSALKLLLAAMIVVFLEQRRLRALDWSWLERRPRLSAMAFGLAGGFLSGTVNVAVPPLVIYFMALGLAPLAMTQILNLCFLVGRTTQAVTLGAAGKLGASLAVATLPLVAVSLVMLFVGMRVQRRMRPEVFQALLRKILWAMALLLVAQVAWQQR